MLCLVQAFALVLLVFVVLLVATIPRSTTSVCFTILLAFVTLLFNVALLATVPTLDFLVERFRRFAVVGVFLVGLFVVFLLPLHLTQFHWLWPIVTVTTVVVSVYNTIST